MVHRTFRSTRSARLGISMPALDSAEAGKMNMSDIVESIAASESITKSDVKKVVDAFLAAIGEAAIRDDEIALAGFGKFKVKHSAARDGRNPATGDRIFIAASRKLAFTPAKALKDKLNPGSGR